MTEQLPGRTFGWSNMFVATRDSDPREQGDPLVGERDTLARRSGGGAVSKGPRRQ
jgi:hypothetical protein